MPHLLQNNGRRALVLLLLCSATLVSCGDPRTVAEYEAWLNDPEQGLSKSRSTDGLDITLKYIPPELLAYNELRDQEQDAGVSNDSLRRQYAGTLNFLMTIQPSKGVKEGGDVMTRGIASQQELNGRILTMNFDFGELVSMQTASGSAKPVLAHFEGSYGLRKERQVVLAFANKIGEIPVLDADTVDIAFVDKVFDTGIHHFVFETSRLRAASELFPSAIE